MSDYDKLMAELNEAQASQEALAKSMTGDGKDDATIAAAAKVDKDGNPVKSDDAVKTPGEDGDGTGETKMTKSIKLADGTDVEVFDGTEMIKALTTKVEAGGEQMAKAMGSLIGIVKGQSELIKSLSERVSKLSGQGTGRKAVLTVNSKVDTSTTPLAKSDHSEMTANEFMAKAMTAMTAGRISATDVAVAEAHINNGKTIPVDLARAVLAS